MHGDRLADDEAIGDKLADGLAGVGVGNLADLVRVEPDLAFAAVGDRGREALLSAEVYPDRRTPLVFGRRSAGRCKELCRARSSVGPGDPIPGAANNCHRPAVDEK